MPDVRHGFCRLGLGRFGHGGAVIGEGFGGGWRLWRGAANAGQRVCRALGWVLQGHGDQKELSFADFELSPEAIPFGQRFDRHTVEARDGKGGFAALHPVAHGAFARLARRFGVAGQGSGLHARRGGGIVDRAPCK